MRIMTTMFYIFIIMTGITFAGLNASSVQINLYIRTITMPVSVLVILMLSLGILFGFLLSLGRYWHLKADYRKIKNQLKLTDKEIQNLRAIPLKDQH